MTWSRSRLGVLVLWGLAAAFAPRVGFAQNHDDRTALLKDQLETLERVIAAAKDPREKSSLEAKAERIRQEMRILQEGHEIDLREQALEQERTQSASQTLRDRLRLIESSQDDAEAKVRLLVQQRRRVSDQRADLEGQLAAIKAGSASDAARVSGLQERIFTANEQLRALALEREAADAESDLARDADRLRAELKAGDDASRPNLRLLFESYSQLRGQEKTDTQITALAAALARNLALAQSAMDLLGQKLAKFDEELAVLEKQTNFFHRDPKVEQFIAAERGRKQALLERRPFVAEQVEALKATRDAVTAREELNALGAAVRQEQFKALKTAYLRRLRWPAVALCAVFAVNLLIGYGLLPVFYERESLFLARRLVRYVFVVVATGIVAGFLFDDLSMVAATLGIVSAALVISLQDVCTSICAWFVILAGGKFRIGDRLEIDGNRGDVIDIQLLRTTLVEVGGPLGVDQPTGRVVLVPNNVIFKTKVFNYNHGHPYVWGKLDVTITYATPLSVAMELLKRVLEEETRQMMEEARKAAHVMQRRYGVQDAEYESKIYTTIADSGVVFSLFFVSHYRELSALRARLSRRILAELEAQKAVQLAYPTMSIVRAAAG